MGNHGVKVEFAAPGRTRNPFGNTGNQLCQRVPVYRLSATCTIQQSLRPQLGQSQFHFGWAQRAQAHHHIAQHLSPDATQPKDNDRTERWVSYRAQHQLHPRLGLRLHQNRTGTQAGVKVSTGLEDRICVSQVQAHGTGFGFMQ